MANSVSQNIYLCTFWDADIFIVLHTSASIKYRMTIICGEKMNKLHNMDQWFTTYGLHELLVYKISMFWIISNGLQHMDFVD